MKNLLVDVARGTVLLAEAQLIIATPTSKTVKATAKASGLMVVPEETLPVVTDAHTAMTDNVEATVLIAVGAGLLVQAPVTQVLTACVKEEAVLEEMLLLLVIGTVTNPSASLEDFHTLTTTNLSVWTTAVSSLTQLPVILSFKVTLLAKSATS